MGSVYEDLARNVKTASGPSRRCCYCTIEISGLSSFRATRVHTKTSQMSIESVSLFSTTTQFACAGGPVFAAANEKPIVFLNAELRVPDANRTADFRAHVSKRISVGDKSVRENNGALVDAPSTYRLRRTFGRVPNHFHTRTHRCYAICVLFALRNAGKRFQMTRRERIRFRVITRECLFSSFENFKKFNTRSSKGKIYCSCVRKE